MERMIINRYEEPMLDCGVSSSGNVLGRVKVGRLARCYQRGSMDSLALRVEGDELSRSCVAGSRSPAPLRTLRRLQDPMVVCTSRR